MRTIKHCSELLHICLLLKQSTQEPFSGYSKYDLCQSNVVCFCLCHSFFFVCLFLCRVASLYNPTKSLCLSCSVSPLGCFLQDHIVTLPCSSLGALVSEWQLNALLFKLQHWTVSSDFGGSRKPPAEWYVFYTAACLSFLKVRHEGKTHHQHAWKYKLKNHLLSYSTSFSFFLFYHIQRPSANVTRVIKWPKLRVL